MMRKTVVIALAACASGPREALPPHVVADNQRMQCGTSYEFDKFDITSRRVLERPLLTKYAEVKYVVIDLSWSRGRKRDDEAAANDALAVLAKLRAGYDVDVLIAQYSDDTNTNVLRVVASSDGLYMGQFADLALRLHRGEAGIIKQYGAYLIIRRIE